MPLHIRPEELKDHHKRIIDCGHLNAGSRGFAEKCCNALRPAETAGLTQKDCRDRLK